jgi:hypothetical protein
MIGLNMWEEWNACRSRIVGVVPKEEEILVDHAEG